MIAKINIKVFIKKASLLAGMLLFFHHLLFAQDRRYIDSLEYIIKNHNATKMELQMPSRSLFDTVAAKILINLAAAYTTHNHDTALKYAETALALSEALNYKTGIGDAYQKIGWIYLNQDNYPMAIKNLEDALAINLQTGNMYEAFGCYFGIGHTYLGKGNLPEALKNYFNALKIAETMQSKGYQASASNGIAGVYSSLGNYAEAKKYILKATQLSEEAGSKYTLSNAYGMMSDMYVETKEYEKALEYSFKALKLSEEINEMYDMGFDLDAIGNIYNAKKQYPQALDYYFKSLKVAEDKGYKQLQISVLNAVGRTYVTLKKNQDAFRYFNKALSLSKQIESLDQIKNCYDNLQKFDSAQGNFKEAFEHYKLYIAAGDSILNNENTKKAVQIQMQFDFDKKQVADSLKFAQEKKINQVKLEKQKALAYGGYAGVFIAVILLFFVYRNYTKERIANQKIKQAHEQLVKGEKMAAFGIMATRVADEIQNPLNLVNNFAELSQDVVADIVNAHSEKDKKQYAELLIANLKKINEHGKRTAAIVEQLQEHSRKGSAHEFFEER